MDLGKISRRTWNTPEKHIMKTIFKSNIEANKVPSAQECVDAIVQHPQLKSRTVPQMQMWIRNYVKKCSRQGNWCFLYELLVFQYFNPSLKICQITGFVVPYY